MNGAPFGSLLVIPALLAIAIILTIGIAIGTTIGKPAVEPERPCIVIDMRTKPGPGRIIPADPGI